MQCAAATAPRAPGENASRQQTLEHRCQSLVVLAARGAKLAATSNPLHTRRHWNDPRFVAHIQEPPDGFPAVVAVVESALVDVHADEFVGELSIEVAGELHGVGESFFAVVES